MNDEHTAETDALGCRAICAVYGFHVFDCPNRPLTLCGGREPDQHKPKRPPRVREECPGCCTVPNARGGCKCEEGR